MVEPGFVVEAFGDFYEHMQIVRAEIELTGRTFKEKAGFGAEFSFRIFALVSADLARGRLNAYGQRTTRTIQEPDERVARTVWQRAIDRQGHSHPIAELADGFFRGGADGDDAGHGFERCLEDCL